MPPRRPTILSTTRGCLLALAFPNAGTFSASGSLGIIWANPADHTELLSPLKGFDFNSGFGYASLNLPSVTSQTLFPSVSIQMYIVDSTGADLYQCGSTAMNANAAASSFDVLSFSVVAHGTPGSGLRGQVNISGTYSVQIPSPLLFFGSMGPT